MNAGESFVISVAVGTIADVGNGPFGFRRFVQSASGTVEGAALTAELLPGGGDWLLVADDGYARADIRYTLKTHDGAFVYVQGKGLIELNDSARSAMSGGAPTDYDDQYVRIDFTFETGDERYAWLNTGIFVGRGRFQPGPSIQYSVERVS